MYTNKAHTFPTYSIVCILDVKRWRETGNIVVKHANANAMCGWGPYILASVPFPSVKTNPSCSEPVVITIVFMHHRRLFGWLGGCCRALIIATGGKDGRKVMTDSHLTVWYIKTVQMSAPISCGSWNGRHHKMLNKKGTKRRPQYWPRTVSVSRRFLNNLEQSMAHLDWGRDSIGSRWLSCILTSTCLGILLALWNTEKTISSAMHHHETRISHLTVFSTHYLQVCHNGICCCCSLCEMLQKSNHVLILNSSKNLNTK